MIGDGSTEAELDNRRNLSRTGGQWLKEATEERIERKITNKFSDR